MIIFTVDIDWANEIVIADTLNLFSSYNVRCTLFATHNSPVLNKCDRSFFEIGLHPNFNTLLQGKGGNPDNILDELQTIYPEAIGVRSHSLTQNGWLLDKFKEKGMCYEVNQFLPYHQGLKPFKLWNGLWRIPFNWEDDYHFAFGYDFEDTRIDLRDEGLNIFNFHPIHVFLNSENNIRYLAVKNNLENIDILNKMQNKSSTKGTRDVLISLLEYVHKNNINTLLLKNIYKSCEAINETLL
ncbi:polysaccharide deacetylase WbmS family protein [Pseudanabaena sp. Chao 1811]|uniref:polysaccharide deacetylase WbmS family protein n=1 Tax=Pseudanabaena sp. Chao 1811 TaxID=2963092 RepID=UPI0022F3D569|nr:hypothetical protein [Pseudanabaena sp. Chao 1811]